jgi:hypothetical protein
MSAPHYPEGGYIGKVTQQALVKSQNKGTPQLVIRFTVESKSDGGDSGTKQERTMYRAITANTAAYVQEDLQKLGFTGSSLSEVDPNSPKFAFDLTGKEIGVYCKHEADQESNLREKWQLSRTFGIEGEPVTDYDSLDSMFDFTATAKPKAAAPKQSKPAAGTTSAGAGSNGSAAGGLSGDELAAKVVELVRGKGNTLAKKSLGVNLLTLKLGRDDIKKAQSEEFVKAYDGVVWKYDGTAITVE